MIHLSSGVIQSIDVKGADIAQAKRGSKRQVTSISVLPNSRFYRSSPCLSALTLKNKGLTCSSSRLSKAASWGSVQVFSISASSEAASLFPLFCLACRECGSNLLSILLREPTRKKSANTVLVGQSIPWASTNLLNKFQSTLTASMRVCDGIDETYWS